MSYTLPPEVITGDIWSASSMNTYVKYNFEAGIPDIFAAKGDLAIASGADAAQRLAVGANHSHLEAHSGEPLGMRWGAYPVAYYTWGNNLTGSWAISGFVSEIIDSRNWFTAATFTPGSPGYFWVFTRYSARSYFFSTSNFYGPNEFDEIRVAIYKTGAMYSQAILTTEGATTYFDRGNYFADLVYCTTSDYIRMYIQDSGSTSNYLADCVTLIFQVMQ